jgi:hypothetical protein
MKLIFSIWFPVLVGSPDWRALILELVCRMMKSQLERGLLMRSRPTSEQFPGSSNPVNEYQPVNWTCLKFMLQNRIHLERVPD